jgi:hypothetical protein
VTSGAAAPREFRWDELQRSGQVSGGAVLPPETGSSFYTLKVTAGKSGRSVTVLTIDRPGISTSKYALSGQVRYEQVEGTGYLELWNYFPNGGQYFSRTLADAGPMMKLHGTSGWRAFTLPFDATGAPPPARLVFNVVLAGGTVYLGPLTLSEGGREDPSAANGWPADRLSRLGGVAGGAIGCVGALIGVLASFGRARRFVMTASIALSLLGAVAFAAGISAVARSLPYGVYYPLLLIGFLSAVIPLSLLPAIRKRYDEIELRMMRSHDVG